MMSPSLPGKAYVSSRKEKIKSHLYIAEVRVRAVKGQAARSLKIQNDVQGILGENN